MPQLNKNKYVALEVKEDIEENDTKITVVENEGKITGVDSYNKRTGVKSESGSMEATEKSNEIALIKEAIAEAEWDITEGTDLIARTETETEDTSNENVIHPYLQVPTVEHTCKFPRGRNPRPNYANRYIFQATIIYFSLTQLSMKRGLNKL